MTTATTTGSGPPTGLDLFVAVMAHITLHPQDHRQSEWMIAVPASAGLGTTCGTAGCIAGWACQFHGMLNHWGNLKEEFHGDGLGYSGHAERLLGLDPDDEGGSPLFDGANTVDDLFRIAAELYDLDEKVLRKDVTAAVEELEHPEQR